MSNLSTARWHLIHSRMPWCGEVTAAVLELINDKLGYASPTAPAAPIAPLPPSSAKPIIAICLGHARPVDEGNVGAGGVSEEEYNRPLVHLIAARLRRKGIETVTVTGYEGATYELAMKWLAKRLLELGVTAAIEYHFNAADKPASGHEVFHWEHSKTGPALSSALNEGLSRRFPWHPDRGVKPRGYRERGALFLSLTHCTAAIVESFFGDNPKEWATFSQPETVEALADCQVEAIASWVERTRSAA